MLDLNFALHGYATIIHCFNIDQMYGPASAGVACALPCIVLVHAPMHVECPTCLQCIIGAFYDVHEVQCCHGVILVQRQIVCKFGAAALLGKGLVHGFHRSTRIKNPKSLLSVRIRVPVLGLLPISNYYRPPASKRADSRQPQCVGYPDAAELTARLVRMRRPARPDWLPSPRVVC